jgi:hypothetical protein
MYLELSKAGPIEELIVLDNTRLCMNGHVFCKFVHERDAADALQNVNGRPFNGEPVEAELSRIVDFSRQSVCGFYDSGRYGYGRSCIYAHARTVPADFFHRLENQAGLARRASALDSNSTMYDRRCPINSNKNASRPPRERLDGASPTQTHYDPDCHQEKCGRSVRGGGGASIHERILDRKLKRKHTSLHSPSSNSDSDSSHSRIVNRKFKRRKSIYSCKLPSHEQRRSKSKT